MRFLEDIGLVAGREVRRSFRSVKGILIAVLALGLGAVGALVIAKLQEAEISTKEHVKLTAEQASQLWEKSLEWKYGDAQTGDYVALAPHCLPALSFLVLWIMPLLVMLLGFDVLASDAQHRGVRFWTVRTTRERYFAGKWLGLWAVASAVVVAMSVVGTGTAIVAGYTSAAEALPWEARLVFAELLAALAWSALVMLAGSVFRVPMLSLLLVAGALFVDWLLHLVGLTSRAAWATFVYPSAYDQWLLSPRLDRFAEGIAVALGFSALFGGGGAVSFGRRDV